MKLASDFRRWFAPIRRTIVNAPAVKNLAVELLEERLAPAGGLLYEATTAAPLTLRLTGNTLEVVNTNTSGVLASKALADITTGVRIEGDGFNVNLTIDDSVPVVPGGVVFAGGAGTNTLIGPDALTTWNLNGADLGTLTSGPCVTFEASRICRQHGRRHFNINTAARVRTRLPAATAMTP